MGKPVFDVPPGATAKVSIIDSTLRISNLKVDYFMGPPVQGFDKLESLPTWSFLVESSAGQKVLFDLGVPKDQNVFPPSVRKDIDKYGWQVHVEKDVADILKEHGVDPSEISSVIWRFDRMNGFLHSRHLSADYLASHFHFDHIGDISTFPSSTELVVGPGFKQKFGRAYPTDPESPVRESYWE